MNKDQIKLNLLSADTWLRILFMAGFAVAVWLTMVVLGVIVVAQLIIVLITSSPNANLQRFGLLTGAYLFEIIQYLLFNTDDKPFPFAPFPDPQPGDDEDDDDDDQDDDDSWHKPAPVKPAPEKGPSAPDMQGEQPSGDIPTLDSQNSDDTQQDSPR